MSKMSELDLCISELRSAADALNAAADNLAALFSGDKPENTPATPEPTPVTLEQVRAVLAEKSRDGHTAAVRALLEKHGASKLSEIDPEKYATLLADAEVL